MDTMHRLTEKHSFDDVMRNHTLEKYKLFDLPSQRNSLIFSDTYDTKIIVNQIEEKINFLKRFGFEFNNICEIKCTEQTWYLKYEGNINNFDIIFNLLMEDISLVYLCINCNIYKNGKMIEIINDIKILYNPYSFRQNDTSIKNTIYDILIKEIKNKNLYLIGGEMVFYCVLLKPNNFIMYTDYESIYEDAITNFSDMNDNITFINYDKDKLKKCEKDYTLIANTSKHGLGDNLCKEINKLELDELVIISCNKKSFIRDLKKLELKYKLIKYFDINTNYSVCVYFLTKK